MLNAARLRVLREVARCGSLAGAADALAYTPSAVSQQIAALEREAGLPLLERLPRGVRLTEPGRLLVGHADAILEQLRAAEQSLAAVRRGDGGRLRLGSFPTANATLMPRAVASFRRQHAGVELVLQEADRDEGLAGVASRELDAALVYEFPLVPIDPPPGVELIWLLDDPLHVALPPGHPLARPARLRLRDLAAEQWVQGVYRGSTRDVLPRACQAAGFEPRIAFRTDDQVTVQGLVAAGVGVALASWLILPVMRADLVVRPLSEPTLTRQVLLAVPAGTYRLPAADAMLDALRQAASSLRAA